MMQNLPSIITGLQLEVQADDLVLDMCAAPGGKTTHIASMLAAKKGSGKVVAFDKSQNKIDAINKNVARFDLDGLVEARVQDGTKVGDNYADETFDKILLDAPCSALGQRPQLVQASRLKEISSFPKLQRKLFSEAVRLLKPGGILVYRY